MHSLARDIADRSPIAFRFFANIWAASTAYGSALFAPFDQSKGRLERLLLRGAKRQVRLLAPLYEFHYRRLMGRDACDNRKLEAIGSALLVIGDSYMLDRRYSEAYAYLAHYKMIADRLAAAESSRSTGIGMQIRHYLLTGENTGAIAALEKMMDDDRRDTEGLCLLMRLYAEEGRQGEAENLYDSLQAKDGERIPQIVHYIRMASGDFRAAWGSYREYKTSHPPSAKPWEGESLEGKCLLVVALSGIGDEIRSASTYGELVAWASRCIITCDPRLATMLRRSFPGAEIVPVNRAHPYGLGTFDARVASNIDIKSLGGVDYFINNLASLQFSRPSRESFFGRSSRLVADPTLLDESRSRIEAVRSGRTVVGICWRSGIISYKRKREYYDLVDWSPILKVPGVAFVNLQYDGREEIRELSRELDSVIDFPDVDLRDDFETLAAIILSCDLVISAPTNVLEYAGILGKEAWMLTASSSLSASWRIIDRNRGDIWFDTVKHYNASKEGGKDSVIGRISDDLDSWSRARHSAPRAISHTSKEFPC